MDIVLRLSTIILFTIWRMVWFVKEKSADREKPKTKTPTLQSRIEMGVNVGLGLFLIPVLLGYQILPMSYNPLVQIAGFIMVVIGMMMSISARFNLGTNWTNASEYQVKKDHSLTTTGIYAYIRHPIYAGLFLSCLGGWLVAESNLWIILVPFVILAYRAGKREEDLLSKHFGKSYKVYTKHTKMFIPFIF